MKIKKQKFMRSGLFVKEFVKQKADTLFYLKRYFDYDLCFFIKNDTFYYILIDALRQKINIIQTLDYHSEKYDLIELNKISD